MTRIVSEVAMKDFGCQLGGLLRGGDVVELIGDVGAGKTTFTKGLAAGLLIDETVQSPSFTVSRTYENAAGVRLVHYDFYRLHDAGIMQQDIQESTLDPSTVTVVEWAAVASGALPHDRLRLTFTTVDETTREVQVTAGGARSQAVRALLV